MILAKQTNAQPNVIPVQDWRERGTYILMGKTHTESEVGRHTHRPQVCRYIEWHDQRQWKIKVMGWNHEKIRVLTWTYYYPDGSRQKQGSFKNGKEHGAWTFWDTYGTATTVAYDHEKTAP